MCFIVKYVLFIANVIFALAGLALIGIGIAVLVQASDLLSLIPINIEAIPITLIVVGAVIFLIAFFGCCGAIRENRCFLSTYAIFLLLLAAGKMYLAVVIFMAMDDIRNRVNEWLANAFIKANQRETFHAVETAFQCCGTTGPESYTGALPPSCCKPDVQVCNVANAFGGCNDEVGEFFATYGEATASVIVVIVGVQLLAMIFSLCFCTNIRNRRGETA